MTQTIAMMSAHDEVDGGRSYGRGMAADSRGLTNGGKAGGGGAQGGDGEPKSKGDWEEEEGRRELMQLEEWSSEAQDG